MSISKELDGLKVNQTKTTEIPKLYTIKNGTMQLNFHPGQLRAWESKKRFVLVLSGTQGGKTSFGPHLFYKWIQEGGPGDYIVAGPSYKLLNLKAIPEFKSLFESLLKLGEWKNSPTEHFTFSKEGLRRTFGRTDEPTTVFFGHADNPDSLESATAKAAWLDEAGQKRFRLGSYEAILRRLSLAQGRVLITTTPYDLGWIKQKLHDPFMKEKLAGRDHPLIDLIRFDSTENPAFPVEEFERARRDMPGWRFDLFYRAIFTQPAGMVYDSFLNSPYPEGHVIKRKEFKVETWWPRWIGLDFGMQNFAAVFFAEEMKAVGQDSYGNRIAVPTGRLILYKVYKPGVNRSAEQHVRAMLNGEPKYGTIKAYGGSHGEQGWRQAISLAGLTVREPPVTRGTTASVDAQISCVYGAHARGEILVMDDLEEYLDEKMSYTREVDESGIPGDKIEDQNKFHLMDAERYIISKLRPLKAGINISESIVSSVLLGPDNSSSGAIIEAPARFLDDLQRIVPTTELKRWTTESRRGYTRLS